MNNARLNAVRMLAATVAIGLGACGPAICQAADTERHSAKKTHKRQAENAKLCVTSLALSKEQAHKLLFLIEDAAQLRIDAYKAEALLLPQIVDAYSQFAAEDSLNQGFTPEVEKPTAQLHRREKEARDKLAAELVVLESQAAALLNPTQLEIAKGQHGNFWRNFGVCGANNPVGYIKGGIAWQRWQDSRNKDRLDKARDELRDHQKKLHPRLGRIGKNLLHPAAASTVCVTAQFRPSDKMRESASIYEYGTPDYPINQYMNDKAAAARLHREINNWNLINGLNLNRKQISKITRMYNSVRGELEGTKGKANQASGRRDKVLFELERKVEATLNPGQLQVLADYSPCLIPPTDLKNPVRAGQAADSSRLVKWLTRARKAARPKRVVMVESLLEREANHYGELSYKQWYARADLLMATARQSAQMSDVDFELNKQELAEAIEPRDLKSELKTEISSLSRKKGLPSTIAKHILNAEFIEQLRSRSQQLAGGTNDKRGRRGRQRATRSR